VTVHSSNPHPRQGREGRSSLEAASENPAPSWQPEQSTVSVFGPLEPLPPPENAVLTALFAQIHQGATDTGRVLIKNLTTKVNEILETSGERFRLSPRKVGAVMAILGFCWKIRTNIGWVIVLHRADQVRVHKLVKTHGMDLNLDRFIKAADLRECLLCKDDTRFTPRPEQQSDPGNQSK